jgi:hypothetical protein
VQLIFQYSFWWLVPIFFLALISAWVLYGRSSEFKKGQRLLLASLRFFLIFLIGFLLLSPMLTRLIEKQEKPKLLWLQDVSASVALSKDSAQIKNWLENEAPALKEQLADRFELVEIPFATDAPESDSLFLQGSYTDIGAALQFAQNAYYNQYVGGAVVLSDGIFNKGSNPEYIARYFDYPIHTVLMGDSIRYVDLRLSDVQANDEAFLQNEFAVNITIDAFELAGENSQLSLKDQSGKTLVSEQLNINENQQSFSKQYFIKPEKAGLRRYTIRLSSLEQEENVVNNQTSFSINISNRQKQIGLMASGTHPDLYAIQAALASSERFKLNLKSNGEGLTEFVAQNDLFILHQPTPAQMDAVVSSTKAHWVIIGPQADAGDLFQQLQVNFSKQYEPTYSVFNTGFTLFSEPEGFEKFIDATTPLLSPFGKYQVQGAYTPLLFKKVGAVQTNDPIWYYQEADKVKRAVTMGINLWRWRIEDYRINRNHQTFDALIQSTATYLSIQESEQRFSIKLKKRYDSREEIVPVATVLNKNAELTDEASVRLDLFDESGAQVTYDLSSKKKQYSTRIKPLAPGVYTYTADAQLGQEEFMKRGAFEVQKLEVEAFDLKARYGLLRNISTLTGGKAFTLDQTNQMPEELNSDENALPKSFFRTETEPLISLRLFFFILLTFAGLEWVLRKYLGKY